MSLKAACILNTQICLVFGAIIRDKMPSPGQHKCPQFGSCNMQVLSSLEQSSFSRHKLQILPFNNAESKNMNTCILQCTFMSISGRRPGGRGGRPPADRGSCSPAPPGHSQRREQTSLSSGGRVTEALLWALGCSGQWWQRTGQENQSGAPRQWTQARLRYR